MKTIRVFFLVCVICTHNVFAGFEQTDAGARVVGVGSAYVGIADDGWAILYNPAGLCQMRQPELSVFYSPQPFGLNELRSLVVVASYPTTLGALGASVRSFGFTLYRETSVGLGYANTIGDVLLGIGLNYHSVSISRYGSAGTFGLDVGLLVPILPNLRWGIAAKNINAPDIGGEKLPQTFTIGFSYQPLSSLSLMFDYAKEVGFNGAPRFGVEYWLIDAVAVRAGAADEPSSFALGVGCRLSFIQIDYAFTTHRDLGLTHQASVTIRWPSDED